MLDEVDPSPRLDRHALAPLYQRDRDLADAALAALPAPPKRVEWDFLENRPLLSLLMRRALWLAAQGQQDAPLRAGTSRRPKAMTLPGKPPC